MAGRAGPAARAARAGPGPAAASTSAAVRSRFPPRPSAATRRSAGRGAPAAWAARPAWPGCSAPSAGGLPTSLPTSFGGGGGSGGRRAGRRRRRARRRRRLGLRRRALPGRGDRHLHRQYRQRQRGPRRRGRHRRYRRRGRIRRRTQRDQQRVGRHRPAPVPRPGALRAAAGLHARRQPTAPQAPDFGRG